MYIRTIDDLILVLTTQAANVVQYQLEVGATAQDITEINNGINNAQAIKAYSESVDVDKKALTQLKDSFLKGEPNTPIGAVPVFGAFIWPSLPPPTAGEIPKANARNRRFDNSPTITDAARVAMMLTSGEGPNVANPATLKPTVEAFSGQTDFLYSLVIGNRNGYLMWEVEVQPIGAAAWTNLGRYEGKSQDFNYNPGAATGPVQIRLRVRLWKGASYVGLWSDEVTITVNP